MAEENNCENCMYYDNRPLSSRSNGTCRFYPPIVHVFKAPIGTAARPVTYWPEVKKDDWCGKFKPKPVNQKDEGGVHLVRNDPKDEGETD